MCNHYEIDDDPRVMEFAAGFANEDILDPRGLEAPLEPVVRETWPWRDNSRLPAVYVPGDGPTLGWLSWGIRPNPKAPKKWVSNARDDQLLASPLWRRYFPRWRCLIPADAFFEPFGPEGARREARFSRPERDPFFFAGIWTAERSFAIVTCPPNPQLAALPHDRMPVILADDAAARAWLGTDGNTRTAVDLLALCRPYPGELIREDMPRSEPRPGKISREDLATGELPLN